MFSLAQLSKVAVQIHSSFELCQQHVHGFSFLAHDVERRAGVQTVDILIQGGIRDTKPLILQQRRIIHTMTRSMG